MRLPQHRIKHGFILGLLMSTALYFAIQWRTPAAGQGLPPNRIFLPLVHEGAKNETTPTDTVAANPMVAAKVGSAVLTQLATQGSANVLIMLDGSFITGADDSMTQVQAMVTAVQEMAMHELHTTDYRRTHWYNGVPAMAGQVLTAKGLLQLAENPAVVRIDAALTAYASRPLGAPAGPYLDVSVPLIGADTWHDRGITGQGVVVAVLDTGIDTDHPDLADAIVHQECFLEGQLQDGGTFPCPNGTGRQSGAGAAEDDADLVFVRNVGCVADPNGGHGTHVSGIITANGVQASSGVAPGVQIVAIKVLDRCGQASLSDILSALDYILVNQPEVKLVNMSLGSSPVPGVCDNQNAFTRALADIVRRLRDRGTLVIASAGNESSAGAVGIPACLSQVIAVGATDDKDAIAAFSNSGPQLDLWAPGVEITSARRNGGTIAYNGTSMSAPHVVGCAALFLNGGIANGPNALATRLATSPVQITDNRNGRTYPRLDCTAPAATSTATPTAIPSSTPGQTPVATNTATPTPTAVPPTATPPSSGVTCFGQPATLIGTNGDDRLEGTSGNDVIVGLRGNDYIIGGGGDDLICGDSGRDLLDGGPGRDQVDGGVDDDMLYGSGGDDLLLGGSGNDRMNGGDDQDAAHGGSGIDQISGGNGNDLLTGGDDDDRVSGGSGDDRINGEAGSDIIAGDEGVDTCDLEPVIDFTNGTCENDDTVATPAPTAVQSATPAPISPTPTPLATATPTTLASPIPTGTATPEAHWIVREIFTPPIIDGVYDDIWETTYAYPVKQVVLGDSVPMDDLSAEFRILYDHAYLYVLVKVYDDQSQVDSGDTWWEDDVVELYLDGDLSRGTSYDGVNDYQLAVRSFTTDWLLGVNSAALPAGATFGGDYEYGWYTVEMAIPLAAVGMVGADGYQFGLDVHVIDDDDGGARETKLAAFASIDDSWENPSHFGIGQLLARRKPIAGGVHIEAEAFNDQNGVETWWGGFGYFDQGDWARYSQVDLGAGVNTFRAELAVPDDFAGGQIEVRLDAPNGRLVGALTVQSTGDWNNYQIQEVTIQPSSGVHDLYIVGAGSHGIANVDWFQLRQRN